jgi:hypothetical protein
MAVGCVRAIGIAIEGAIGSVTIRWSLPARAERERADGVTIRHLLLMSSAFAMSR